MGITVQFEYLLRKSYSSHNVAEKGGFNFKGKVYILLAYCTLVQEQKTGGKRGKLKLYNSQ